MSRTVIATVACEGVRLKLTLTPKFLSRSLNDALIHPFMKAFAKRVRRAKGSSYHVAKVSIDGTAYTPQDFDGIAGEMLMNDSCTVEFVLGEGTTNTNSRTAADEASSLVAALSSKLDDDVLGEISRRVQTSPKFPKDAGAVLPAEIKEAILEHGQGPRARSYLERVRSWLESADGHGDAVDDDHEVWGAGSSGSIYSPGGKQEDCYMKEREIGSYTPALNLACCTGSLEMARLLLENGAKVKTAPLTIAAPWATPHHNLSQVNRADWSGGTGNGATALHYAASACSAPLVELLITHKADVNAQTSKYRRTALMDAAVVGAGDVPPRYSGAQISALVETLLKAGAGPHLRDNQGTTALQMAAERQTPMLVRMGDRPTVGHELAIKLLAAHMGISAI